MLTKTIKLGIYLLAVSLIVFPGMAKAEPYLLTNGPGDGTIDVGVDGLGAFGSSGGADQSDAFYDPVGATEPSGTTFESYVALGINGESGFGASRELLTTGDGFSNPSITGDNLQAFSSFTNQSGILGFELTQTVFDSFEDGFQIGTRLNQTYEITNNSAGDVHFELIRYLDGDLQFDESIDDGGGRIELGGNEVLFETDAASGSEASTTFVGITGTGGETLTANRYQISSFSGLQSNVDNGEVLGDFVENDDDGDGFIDSAFDVTLALRNEFFLAAGETVRYVTETIFGNAVPPAPGSTESFPLLPADDEGPFVFEIDLPGTGDTIWFDPPVSVGYDYEISVGPNFASVTLPTGVQSTLFEVLIFDGTDFVSQGFFSPGDTFDFVPAGVSLFRILGINPNLGLDPNDPLAFPTGLSFVAGGVVSFSQTPITVDVNNVPEPSILNLLMLPFVFSIFYRCCFRKEE